MIKRNYRSIVDNTKFKPFHLTILLWCTFIVIAEGYDLVVYGSIVPYLLDEWSLTTVEAGAMGSYGLVGMMVGSIILGILADKFGRKNIVILSVIIFSIFTGLSGFADNPTFFSWCRFFAGVGIGGALPNAVGLMTDYAPKVLRTTLIAIVLTGMQIGGVIAPLISINLAPTFGWQFVLWIGALPLLAVPFMFKYLPESTSFLVLKGDTDQLTKTIRKIDNTYVYQNEVTASPVAEESAGNSPLTVFKEKRGANTILFWVAYFMCLFMIYGLNTWLPKLMMESGYGLNSSLSFLIILNAAAIIGTFLFGRIADKWDSKKLLVVLFLLGAISLALLGFKNDVVIIYILVGLAGACTMGTQNIANAFVSQYYPAAIRSTGLGMSNGIGRIGGMTGPIIGGFLLSWSLPGPMNFLVFAAAGFIAAGAYFLVKVPKSQEETSRVVIPNLEMESTEFKH
ncbi:MFS transporter [Psychrobacillus vulpis]|nr:aromatic acid/H+ symport family MFS transporter [Psychrobacillus vulpis]